MCVDALLALYKLLCVWPHLLTLTFVGSKETRKNEQSNLQQYFRWKLCRLFVGSKSKEKLDKSSPFIYSAPVVKNKFTLGDICDVVFSLFFLAGPEYLGTTPDDTYFRDRSTCPEILNRLVRENSQCFGKTVNDLGGIAEDLGKQSKIYYQKSQPKI